MAWVRWRTKRSRVRNTTAAACWFALLRATKRMVGRWAASQIASASAMSLFCRLTNGFTYAGAMRRTVWPSLAISRPQSWALAHASRATVQGGSVARNARSWPRRSFWRKTTAPALSAPWESRRRTLAHVADHLGVSALEQQYRSCTDVTAARHLQTIWLLAKGHGIAEVAATVSYAQRWVERLLARYNAQGPQALGDLRRRNGTSPSVLRPDLLDKLKARLLEPPPDGGLWTSPKVAAWMAGELGLAAVLPQRGWEALKAINWSVQKPRPRHPASATPEEREAFKKSWSRPSLRRGPLPPIIFPGGPERWWGDEALKAEADAPQATLEQRHQAAGDVLTLHRRGFFFGGGSVFDGVPHSGGDRPVERQPGNQDKPGQPIGALDLAGLQIEPPGLEV